MNEFLTQTFGANGVLIEQSLISVLAVLAVGAAAYWLVRRFSRLRLGGISRGRVARLAIVDAIAIDGRRQLLLVRRDTVEHLLLIGGPADLVVEPSIVRTRQRAAQASTSGQATVATGAVAAVPELAATMAAPAAIAPPGPAGEAVDAAANAGPAIPFPFARIPPARPATGLGNGAAETNGAGPASEFAPHTGWFGAANGASVAVLDAGPEGLGAAMPLLPARSATPAGSDGPGPFAANGQSPGHSNGATLPGPPSQLPHPDSAAHKVSELEAEMNRLLGQLSADRRSS